MNQGLKKIVDCLYFQDTNLKLQCHRLAILTLIGDTANLQEHQGTERDKELEQPSQYEYYSQLRKRLGKRQQPKAHRHVCCLPCHSKAK